MTLTHLTTHKLSLLLCSIIFSLTACRQPNPSINSFEIDMVFVEGGSFTMGATSEQENDYDSNERPTHRVKLNSFYIGKYEVTQKQWCEIMGKNPSFFIGDSLPVEQVNWSDVQEFIKKLNDQTGKNYRLPTEAEWEYVARGGKRSQNYKYSGSNIVDHIAWYWDNSNSTTHAVGTKLPNELGIYDMSGNVWEWCNDWYDNYNSSSQINPIGALSGSYRVIRGGCWIYDACRTRVSLRYYNSPDLRYSNLGFRLAHSR